MVSFWRRIVVAVDVDDDVDCDVVGDGGVVESVVAGLSRDPIWARIRNYQPLCRPYGLPCMRSMSSTTLIAFDVEILASLVDLCDRYVVNLCPFEL